MLIDSTKIDANLDKLQNLYTCFGVEPLLIQQSCDKILSHLKTTGFVTKFIFNIDAKFNFLNLKDELVAGDLFITQKIIQLNIPKVTAKIAEEIKYVVSNIKQGVVVLILFGKLTPTQKKAKWFKELESGLVIQHNEVYANKMLSWVSLEMQKAGLQKNPEIAKIIAESSEGNLLNANNELQKLKFIYGNQVIATKDFIKQSKQQSIYSIYSLIDNALLGKVDNVIKIYNNLKIDEIYLNSLLCNQIRQLITIHLKIKQKIPKSVAIDEAGVWSSKSSLINSALQRHSYSHLQKMLLELGKVDRAIKGLDDKNIQQGLMSVILNLSGVKNG